MPVDPVADPLHTIERPSAIETSTDASAMYPNPEGSTLSTDRPVKPVAPWPAIPGYEVTRELGRGGMGVVYLALQHSLKRLVALKMIRSATDASAEELERFRVEGEAVARLQHPNIVQIFEVGEHEGRPFFSLEYVAGGSMAEALAAGDWTPAASAETIETLARALQHAHQKNVVHRDLKPANVLLTAERLPKVTDFGLAKCLEDVDSGHTRTGALMGTPSYMSPEQAEGLTRNLGPATDIYTLGVMLYECLAGRVPFRAESVLATLDLIRLTEPVPPSKVRPGIPRDLETICLKAMAKAPAARYASALALAQDLERFRGGEPILGRREGTLLRLARKVRRKKAAILAAAAVLLAVATVSAAVFSDRNSRARRGAEERVASGLEQPEWTGETADAVERDIARLAELDPERGRASRQKLVERFAAAIGQDLKKPRVLEADVAGLEARLAWLASRDSTLADGLKKDLRARLRAWQPSVALAAPFANAADVFPAGAGRIEADRYVPSAPMLFTRIPARGTIKAEVDFVGEWPKASSVGILIGLRPGGAPDHTNGYAFVLRPAWPAADPDAPARTGLPASFEAVGGAASLEILRDGAQLGVASVHVRPGPLRLTAEREGDRLSIRLNGADAVAFEDPVVLSSAEQSNLAILCPTPAAIDRFTVERPVLAPAASRLERADDSAARGQTADALALYEAFALETADAEGAAEARYKAGMCLVRLSRAADAVKRFEEVTSGGSARWGVVGAFQLWLIHLDAKRHEEADAVLSVIKVRFPKETIARYVPAAIRNDIWKRMEVLRLGGLVHDPKLIAQMESNIRLAEVLQLDGAAKQFYASLSMAHALAGDLRKARKISDEHLDALLERGHEPWESGVPHYATRWHAWFGRLDGGRTAGYDDLLAKHLNAPLRPGEDENVRKRAFLPLRLESARNAAAAGDWTRAESQLDAYLAEFPKPVTEFAWTSSCHLMKGFARLRANDPKGAEVAWKAGSYAQFVKEHPPAVPAGDRLPLSRGHIIEAWILAALSQSLTDEDSGRIVKSLVAVLGADEVNNQLIEVANISPAIIRGTWTSPRGKEWARRWAFLDMVPIEYAWTAPRLLIYEKLRQDLFDGKPTPEQDEAAWVGTVRICEAFRTSNLSKAQLFQLALAWKGTTNFLGWGGLAPKIGPELRAPLAYALGVRYRKSGKSADAAAMFKTVLKDAPPGSALAKLAEAEAAMAK